MTLRRCFLLLAIISILFVSAFAYFQSPEDKEAPDIAKIRDEWFYGPRRDPQGHARGDLRLKALQQKEQMRRNAQSGGIATSSSQSANATTTSALSTAATTTTPAADLTSTPWQPIGPQPMNNAGLARSGRVMAVAVDPRNSSVVYLGTGEGGVWKTANAGASWTPLTDDQVSLATGALALDPSSPDTIYVGTGEGTGGGTTATQYYGAGILKSTDGGNSWTNIPGPFAKRTFGSGGSRILELSIDPTNTQTLIAAVSSDYQSDDGIWRSTDGANTWTHVVTCEFPWSAFFVANGTGFATCKPTGAASSQVLKSSDGGATWNATGTGLGTAWDFIELTAAPSNPSIMYAGLELRDPSTGSLTATIYKSVDGGTTFTQLTNAPVYCNQCSYANVIRVSPADPNYVFAGGLDLWRSLDGGTSWTDVSSSSNSDVLHADQHAIAFAQDGSLMFEGNDGGVSSSTNYAALSSNSLPPVTWKNLNSTLNTALLYPGLSIDRANANRAFAGTQDNGTLGYNGTLPWDILFCGDGGFTVAPGNGTVYATCFLGLFIKSHVYRSTADGAVGTWMEMPAVTTESMVNITPPFVGDPSSASRLYFGAQHVFQSNDGAQSWQAISPSFSSALGAIAVSPSNPNVVWAGVQYGGIIRVTQNALSGTSATWSATGALLPQHRALTSLAVDAHNPALGYATVAGFSGFGDTGHVFMSTNYGASWSDISSNLPNIPANAVVVDPDGAGTLYVATDVGAFYSTNNGAGWAPAGTGLPNVVTQWLTLHEASRTLRASTHGRGAWDLQLPAGTTSNSCTAPASAGVNICTPANAATVGSPVHISAAATGATAIQSMKIYLDGTSAYTVNASSLDTSLNMAAGAHRITVKGWDTSSTTPYSSTINITVGTSAGVTVAISPTSATVAPGGTQQFTATVQNASNTSVTWSVDGVAGGNSTAGTVSISGLYTAPSSSGTHQVTATSSADATKTASASVTVSSSTTTSCTASSVGVNICSPANGATVSSPLTIVAAAKGNAPIQTMKIYVDGTSSYTVNASSVDTSLTMASGSHRVTVKGWDTGGAVYSSTSNITVGTSTGVSVTISPTSATVALGGTQQFSAALQNSSNTSVSWSVDGVAGGNASVGTISTSGLYTAPAASGTHQVNATSSADTTKSASATVTVASSTTSCTASTVGVNICQPANGATVSSPVKIVAAAKGNAPIQTMKIYLDGTSVYTVQAGQINTSLTMAAGAHRVTVKGWETGGVVYSSTINITIGTSSAAQHSVDLNWIDTGTATAGFNVYRSSTSDGTYTKMNNALVPLPTFTDTAVEAGQTYYYVVTSVDTAGVESAYSNQATALIPPT